MYKVEIIADSVSPLGYRLITLTATYPRFIHEELLTHKDLSRNSASSRAIPTARLIEMIENDCAIPAEWGRNKPGMQASEKISPEDELKAEAIWRGAAMDAIRSAKLMAELNVHKQCVNRILQPFMWMTVVITSTQWENLFWRRCDSDADPTFQRIAYPIRDAIDQSKPRQVHEGYWHLPFITELERNSLPISMLQKMSAARCGRVSYLKPGESSSSELDVAIRMAKNGHWSPFEHQAEALGDEALNYPKFTGNLKGWKQLRKMFPDEYRQQARYGRL